ncbi:MAG TPA: hypothetical protein VGD65_18975 [Chryseosolibacter sp.]
MNSQNHNVDSEKLLAAFAEMSKAGNAFVAMDYNLKFLFVNELAEKFYKKEKSQLVGHSVESIFPKEMEFGPFKNVIKDVRSKKAFEISYLSPFAKDWVKLVGQPHEEYYTFTYRVIDYKEVLKDELRNEMKKSRAHTAK